MVNSPDNGGKSPPQFAKPLDGAQIKFLPADDANGNYLVVLRFYVLKPDGTAGELDIPLYEDEMRQLFRMTQAALRSFAGQKRKTKLIGLN